MPNIIDIIDHKYKYGVQRFVVLDVMPTLIFRRISDRVLLGQDDGVFAAYGYEQPGPTWKAFGGAKFDLQLEGGEVIHASGQWWWIDPNRHCEIPLTSTGVGTPEGLAKCNVFQGMFVATEKIDRWLAENEPSTDYYKYRSKQPA